MIKLKLNGLPPSSNHAYFNHPKGGRVLTAVGKKYKNETTAYLVKQYPAELKLFHPDKPYGVLFVLQTPALFNKGWPKTADSRYKKLDASNRVKLIEDALVDAIGIDDSQFMFAAPLKLYATEEKTTVWAWSVDEEGPIPNWGKNEQDYV